MAAAGPSETWRGLPTVARRTHYPYGPTDTRANRLIILKRVRTTQDPAFLGSCVQTSQRPWRRRHEMRRRVRPAAGMRAGRSVAMTHRGRMWTRRGGTHPASAPVRGGAAGRYAGLVVDVDSARTYQVRTFGCQMNVHDSERIGGLLEEAGYVPVEGEADPDLVVFNTCAVRENADNKLYGNLGHLRPAKTANPDMQIAVGGCLAQKDRGEIVKRAPWV